MPGKDVINIIEEALSRSGKRLPEPIQLETDGIIYTIREKWFGNKGILWVNIQAMTKDLKVFGLSNPYGLTVTPKEVAQKRVGEGKPTSEDFENDNIVFVHSPEEALKSQIEALVSMHLQKTNQSIKSEVN